MSEDKETTRIRQICDLLYEASQSIRILSHIGWPESIREGFFAKGGKELPEVSYPAYDVSTPLEIVRQARRSIQVSGADASDASNVDAWLERQADVIERSARMLAACGTAEFFELSSQLYGTPRGVLTDQISSPFALASEFDRLTEGFSTLDLGAPPVACHLAQTVAQEMEIAVKAMFGDEAPEVEIVDELSANALAGPRRIRIRRTACFTDKDILQLIHHEAYIHVATSLNGLSQPNLKILGAGHPGTTRTQEGLAVFAEFITGSIDLDRMRRLADRVLAIQMSIEGADFLEVYRYFLERAPSQEQAFESTRRVFRGGVLTGGAPFTKDVVYLDGLLRIHNFLRTLVTAGRADCLRLLFCGKLDLEDLPVIYELSRRGLCQPPRYLPPWAQDLRFLLCHLTYSSFLNNIDLDQVRSHYQELLAAIPPEGV